ncbi:helix-turn-helix transcriptional regulator [Congregibacter brevis]|uniref:Helix-turn-helix transcriptional regulator n=1 Tax=Congregibacter brevis TaxID=3081201 RepID=A0ABZ0I7R6_9GAMM|nr:helix-turn-helix transcriptional regulator [Congregibacter sp. IMCC45268]
MTNARLADNARSDGGNCATVAALSEVPMAKPFTTVNQQPMVRLGLALPFLETLVYSAGEADRVLNQHKVSRDMLARDDVFVSAQTMYQLVEDLSVASKDPYAGVHVGAGLDVKSWPPVATALSDATSFGDFLLRFSIAVNRDATSVFNSLETRLERATFSELRINDYGVKPAHNDGFGIAYLSKILLTALGKSRFNGEVVAHVCDHTVIPVRYLGMRVAKTGTSGFSLSFPSAWLLSQIKPSSADFVRSQSTAPKTVSESLARVIAPYLSDDSLTAVGVAKLMGMSERSLARHLANESTSIHSELTRLRMDTAETLIRTSDKPIATIANEVGYADTSTFTRAFRRCYGGAPTTYRATQK